MQHRLQNRTWAGLKAESFCLAADALPYAWLRMQGTESLDLLQRLSTNDMRPLQEGQLPATYTTLLNAQGRLIDWLWVWRRDDGIWLRCHQDRAEEVRAWLDTYTIMEDVVTESCPEVPFVHRRLWLPDAEVPADLAGIEAAHKLDATCVSPWPAPLGMQAWDLLLPADTAAWPQALSALLAGATAADTEVV